MQWLRCIVSIYQGGCSGSIRMCGSDNESIISISVSATDDANGKLATRDYYVPGLYYYDVKCQSITQIFGELYVVLRGFGKSTLRL